MSRCVRLLISVVCLGPLLDPVLAGPAREDLEAAAKSVLSVGSEGQGNETASAAWKVLASAQPDQLSILFTSLDQAGPVPANYLRSAIEVAIEHLDASQRPPVTTLLREILLNRSRSFSSRNLAFEAIGSTSPGLRETLLPEMRDDPSEFLRRESVQQLLEQAKSTQVEASSRSLLQQALQHARDPEQVQEIAKRLEKMGAPVDLPRHFGFLTHWQVIGPFDNSKREGFARVEPPEKDPDLSKTYPGKHGPASWKPFATPDPFGKVDFNQALGTEKEVLGYALAEFVSEGTREVELRLGTKNAWKLWLNGKLLFERDEYHRGQRIDQYRIKASLQSGRNLILVKCCQNEEVKAWTVEWEFQLRVCDATGTAVLAANRLPTPKPDVARRPPPAAAATTPASSPVSVPAPAK